MRLRPKEIDAIAQAAKGAFVAGTAVFLFGSRVDDSKRGGDAAIDAAKDWAELYRQWRIRLATQP